MSRIYRPEDCKFAVGELVKVRETVLGGYEKDILYAAAGDTGVVVQVPRTARPMRVQVKMDAPRRPYGVMVFSEDNLEPA